MRRFKAHVHLDHGRATGRIGPEWSLEDYIARFHYGYGHASPYVELSSSTDRTENPPMRFLRRGLTYVLGFDLLHAYANRRGLTSADIIWTRTEHESLAVALLKRLHLIGDVPLIGGAIWLWDDWPRRGVRRAFYTWLCGAIDLHTAQSFDNTAVGTQALGQPVVFLPYGVSTRRPPVAPPRSDPGRVIHVVAPGNDRHRDWDTLVAAVCDNSDFRLRILSRRSGARAAAKRCDRVEVFPVDTRERVFEEYSRADVVAVPLRFNRHNSGATVGFESVLAGRPLAITATGGLQTYLRDYVSWAEVGDPRSMADAIRAAASRGASAQAYDHLGDRGLTIRDYGLRHVLATWFTLGVLEDVATIEALEPIEPLVAAVASSDPISTD